MEAWKFFVFVIGYVVEGNYRNDFSKIRTRQVAFYDVQKVCANEVGAERLCFLNKPRKRLLILFLNPINSLHPKNLFNFTYFIREIVK